MDDGCDTQGPVCNAQNTLHISKFTLYNVKCTINTVQYTVYSIKCTVYRRQCNYFSTQCAAVQQRVDHKGMSISTCYPAIIGPKLQTAIFQNILLSIYQPVLAKRTFTSPYSRFCFTLHCTLYTALYNVH